MRSKAETTRIPATVVEMRKVCTRFGEHVVHAGINLEVRRAEVFAVIGGSGSGIMITHDLDLLWRVADRVAVLADGKVQGIGSMAQLARLDEPAVRSFFDGPRARAAQQQEQYRSGSKDHETPQEAASKLKSTIR
jgi:ABC-type transporter Mla maintaining outer membrane lipid asymmetry ATPase subunit MlaF